jgi:hypothetical protein
VANVTLERRRLVDEDSPMRLAVLLVVGLAGCSSEGRSSTADAAADDANAFEPSCQFEGRTYDGNETWMVECNSCRCRGGQAQCTIAFCANTNGDESDACTPAQTGTGPRCGDSTCEPGERCNGWTCVCGDRDVVCDPLFSCGQDPQTCGDQCVSLGI